MTNTETAATTLFAPIAVSVSSAVIVFVICLERISIRNWPRLLIRGGLRLEQTIIKTDHSPMLKPRALPNLPTRGLRIGRISSESTGTTEK